MVVGKGLPGLRPPSPLFAMYLATVDCATSIPSFSSSPWMRGAPHSRLARLSEAGGQLFATVSEGLIDVIEATGPRPTDQRSVFGYVPDRDAERLEIKERFAAGLHFVGDWHSHRQRHPYPSTTDIESMGDMVQRSDHSLAGFVLIVVDTAKFP